MSEREKVLAMLAPLLAGVALAADVDFGVVREVMEDLADQSDEFWQACNVEVNEQRDRMKKIRGLLPNPEPRG